MGKRGLGGMTGGGWGDVGTRGEERKKKRGMEKGLGTRGGKTGEKNEKKGEEGLIAGCCAFGLGGSGVFPLVPEVLLIWRKGERDS